jgi:hypothetical protein
MALYYVAGKLGQNGRYEEIARDSHREEYEQALAPARGSGVILIRIMDILLHRIDRANPQYRDRFPLLLRAVVDARAPRPEIPGKEALKVRTSDLAEWERVLRTIVPEHESAA